MPFQSTPSLRKATDLEEEQTWHLTISIHTFLAEGDDYSWLSSLEVDGFQSTPSLRKATQRALERKIRKAISIHTFLAEGDIDCAFISETVVISIHTFLAEGDRLPLLHCGCPQNFNPHLPCGRRQFIKTGIDTIDKFQSTPSLRKAT